MRAGAVAVAGAIALTGTGAVGAGTQPVARIAYAHGSHLGLVNADGSGRITLAGGSGLSASGPDWSPGGDAIAFVQEPRRDGRARLYRVGADGHALRRLTSTRENETDVSPAWRPDGRRIAFLRLRFGRDRIVSEIRTIDPRGGSMRLVHREVARNALTALTDVTWAPDGSILVFTRLRTGRELRQVPSLWQVRASGGTPRLVAREAADASFAPDGSRMAFSSTRDHAGQTCGSDECWNDGEIYVMNADGSAQRRLTRNRADDTAPAWAPDGRHIAYSSDRNSEERPEIYSIRPDGACLTWITNGTPDSAEPAWEAGAQRSSSPRGCGARGLTPAVDVSVARATRFHGFPVWWLGRRTLGGLLLDYAFVERRSVGFTYEDCGRWSRRRCAARLPQIENESACSRQTLVLHGDEPRQLRRLRGALAYRQRGYDWPSQIYAGRTVVSLAIAKPRRFAAFARHLRRLRAAHPPRRLPRAGFSRRVWRRYDRAVRALRRTGSVGRAARALHKRPGVVRARIAMRRKLRRLGARRLHC